MKNKLPRFTGNRRFRIHHRFFRHSLMVLQVQSEGEMPYETPRGVEMKIKRWWSDAEIQDFDSSYFELKQEGEKDTDIVND